MAEKAFIHRRIILVTIFLLCVFMPAIAQTDSTQTLVQVIPGKRYEAGAIHKFFLGSGYRDVWTSPVQIPVLDLNTFAGGLTPLKRGGGLQTRSLRFQGADGQVYVFRSVDKYPERGYPEAFRGTIIETLGKDQVSLMLPFGSLIVSRLADSLGVLHSRPHFFVMPDDKRLDEYRKEFAGMLGSLEVRPDEMPGDEPGFAGSEKIIGSEKFSARLDKDAGNQVDAKAYLTARLLDIFVGDWDRHADQWRWASYKDSTVTWWKPIARDRDFSFVVYDGVIPYLLDREWANLDIDGYNRKEPDIVSLTNKARYLDGRLLAGMDWPTWRQITDDFLEKLDDKLIINAVKTLPEEVYNIVGDELLQRMKRRRSQMQEISRAFYEYLFRTVNIQTTNDKDIVQIEKHETGDISIRIHPKKNPDFIFYDRTIEHNITAEIRLYLLGDDDIIKISGPNTSDIKLRIIGGKGDEQIIEKDITDHIYFYDTRGDMKKLHVKNIKLIAASKKEAYARPPIGYPESRLTREIEGNDDNLGPPFDYGYSWMPLQAFGYDRDHGISIGAGLALIKYGFRYDPYASKRQITAKTSFRTGKYQIRYKAVHYDFIRGMRLKMDIKTSVPESKPNFFGFGNNTPFDEELEEKDYYRAENKSIVAVNELYKEMWSDFFFMAGMDYQYLSTELDQDLLITALNDSGAYKLRTGVHNTLALTTGLEIDLRDNELSPVSGLYTRMKFSYFPGRLDVKEHFFKMNLSGRLYYTILQNLTLALRMNSDLLFGDYPYYHAAYLGGKETLRGYNLNRFAGDASLSGSFEARWLVRRIRLIFPTDFGLIGFTDAGRVWYDKESSGGWHNSIGGGIYLAPLIRDYTFSFTVSRSEEIMMFYWNMGFAF